MKMRKEFINNWKDGVVRTVNERIPKKIMSYHPVEDDHWVDMGKPQENVTDKHRCCGSQTAQYL